MAAAISYAEGGRLSRAGRQPARSVNTRGRPQLLSPSSSSTTISGAGAPGVGRASSDRTGSIATERNGEGSGIWASLLSLAASAFPPSFLPFAGNGERELESQEEEQPHQDQQHQHDQHDSSIPRGFRSSRVLRGPRATIASTATSIASSAGRRLASSSGNRNAYAMLPLSIPSSGTRDTAAGNSARFGSGQNGDDGQVAIRREERNEPAVLIGAPRAPGVPARASGTGVFASPALARGRNARPTARGVRLEGMRGLAGPAPATSASSRTPPAPAPATSKGKVYLERGGTVYTCSVCRSHLSTRDHVISELFHGQGGRAFLFERCVNVSAGKPESRELMTGSHVVADISCNSCGAELGWKYEQAAKEDQKYKEGKYILERCAVTPEGCGGDGYQDAWNTHRRDDPFADRHAYEGFGDERYGSDSGFMGWGAENAPFAAGGRW